MSGPPVVAHERPIARRRTADGKAVLLWADGGLTWPLGHVVKGSATPRTPEQSERALAAGWLVMGEVELYDAEEVPTLVAAARWVADRGGLPGDVRDRVRALSSVPKLKPVWVRFAGGVRVWCLPRLRGFRGLAVWFERGRYEVMRDARNDGCYEPTGFSARTLREIHELLPQLVSR